MACRRYDWCLFILLALALMVLPLRWLLAVLFAAAVHELGHYIVARLCGVEVGRIRFGINGAKMEVGQMEKWQELLCALAGPLAGMSLVLVARWLPRTAVCACIHSAYNMLPIYPLDGGRMVRCVCASLSVCCFIEWGCLALIALAGLYGTVIAGVGIVPLVVSALTIGRALAGKGLAKKLSFRYNRVRIYE